MTERTTVRLPEELLERARRKAASENRTLTSLIEDGLRAVVDDNRRTQQKKRVTPRLSKAGGGLMPGIDLTNPSALQEVEDLDAIGRMRRSE